MFYRAYKTPRNPPRPKSPGTLPIAQLSTRILLNAKSASKITPLFSPQEKSPNLRKIKATDSEDSTSFSSIDQSQFDDIIEGRKHTDTWVTKLETNNDPVQITEEISKNKAKEIAQESLGNNLEVIVRRPQSESAMIIKTDYDHNRSPPVELVPVKKCKNTRKTRIKNECTEYLMSTISNSNDSSKNIRRISTNTLSLPTSVRSMRSIKLPARAKSVTARSHKVSISKPVKKAR